MINIFEPNVTQSSVALLEKVFESKWLGRGHYVSEFENRLSETLRVSSSNLHTISCCTDAIFGIFEILDIQPGQEVIIPSISFPAIGSAVISAKLKPRIVDIDLNTGNIDLTRVADILSANTAAIFVTHYGGIPVDINKLRQLVGPNVYILEDAACAFGTYVDGVACGTEGDFGCWSFDAMKLLTCGEGAGIFLSDSMNMQRAKEYFYLGLPVQSKSGIDRQTIDTRWWEYQLNTPGRRSMFTNINAAIGLPQFDKLEDNLGRRQTIRNHYCKTLDRVGVNYLMQSNPNVSYSNYFFTIMTNKRDSLAAFLKEKQIYSTFRYYPLHLITLFESYAEDCSSATNFSNLALNIPIHHSLSDSDISRISETLQEFYL